MFYQEEMDRALRFGDVISGFVSSTPMMEEPAPAGEHRDFRLDVCLPMFLVILSPCCSIREKTLSLAPLKQIALPKVFDNPYFSEDLTRINRVMTAQQAVVPRTWDQLPEDEKQKRLGQGIVYTLVSLFIYEGHDRLPEYEVDRKGDNIITNKYVIDFRDTFRVNCPRIVTPRNAPVEARILQLSVQTRAELRDKIASYYARVPEEDAAIIG